MTDPTLPLASLSPVYGKAVAAKFDGGLLSSDGGVLALREAEQRLGRRRTISLRISGSSVRRPVPSLVAWRKIELLHGRADRRSVRR